MRIFLVCFMLITFLSACQKPYEKMIEDSTEKANPNYKCVSIGNPIDDEIDNTLWMPIHHIALGETDYYGPVKVVEHKFLLGESTDTITELWIFDKELKHPIFVSQR